MVEDTGETCFHCPFPSFTMILVIPTTLSQDRKLTHDKTLPLRGGMPPVLARSWHGQHVGFACGAKSVDFAATANN